MTTYFLSQDGNSQDEPFMVQLKNGNFLGLWDDLGRDPGLEGGYGVYARILAPEFNRATDPFAVPSSTVGAQSGGMATSFRDGSFVVGFESRGPSAINGHQDNNHDIYLRFFRTDGVAKGKAIQITPNSDDDHYIGGFTTLSNNQLLTVVARSEGGGRYDLLAYRYSADGRQIGEAKVLADDIHTFAQGSRIGYLNPTISSGRDGTYIVSWNEYRDYANDPRHGYEIRSQAYKADGTALGAESVIAPVVANGRSGLDQTSPSITSLSSGRFVVGWSSGDDAYLRVLSSKGAPTGEKILANSDRKPGEQSFSDLVDLGGRKFLATYKHSPAGSDAEWLMGRAFDAAGKPLAGSFKVTDFSGQDLSRGQTLIDSDGRLVTTYTSGDQALFVVNSLTLPVVSGSSASTLLQGTYVNDRIRGNGGNDTINGDRGDDRLSGGSGNDLISGDAGNDVIWGDAGNDRLRGGDGNDKIYGGSGNDRMAGGSGNDLLEGGTGHELMWGDAGADRLRGGAGNDTLYGGSGNDRVAGGDGNDRMFGDSGNDVLWGNAGADRLRGGTGNDTLYGGSGADTFIFGKGFDRDVIADFENNVDTVAMSNGIRNFSQARSYAEQVGKDVVFDFGGGDVLTVKNITIAALADDMVFL